MVKPKSRKKRAAKRVLALPDLEHAKTAVLNSLTSSSGQRTYDHAIREHQSALGRCATHRVRSQWQFTPTLLNCETIDVSMKVTTNFSIQP